MTAHQAKQTDCKEQDEGPVFEIRIYGFNIKGLSEYLKLMTGGFWELRSSFSSVLGPWKTELNGLCEMLYIGHYESLTHLLATRKKMLSNAEWNGHLTRISDLQMSFHNILTVLLPGTELNTNFQPSESAVYELQTVPEDEHRRLEPVEGATVVGRFLSVYGPSKTEYCLLRYPDPKTAFAHAYQQRTRGQQLTSFCLAALTGQPSRNGFALPPGANTRLMVPVLVSKLK